MAKVLSPSITFVNEKYEYIRINLTEIQDLYMDKNGNFALVHKKFFNWSTVMLFLNEKKFISGNYMN